MSEFENPLDNLLIEFNNFYKESFSLIKAAKTTWYKTEETSDSKEECRDAFRNYESVCSLRDKLLDEMEEKYFQEKGGHYSFLRSMIIIHIKENCFYKTYDEITENGRRIQNATNCPLKK